MTSLVLLKFGEHGSEIKFFQSLSERMKLNEVHSFNKHSQGRISAKPMDDLYHDLPALSKENILAFCADNSGFC